jgi:hypothetical protein
MKLPFPLSLIGNNGPSGPGLVFNIPSLKVLNALAHASVFPYTTDPSNHELMVFGNCLTLVTLVPVPATMYKRIKWDIVDD